MITKQVSRSSLCSHIPFDLGQPHFPQETGWIKLISSYYFNRIPRESSELHWLLVELSWRLFSHQSVSIILWSVDIKSKDWSLYICTVELWWLQLEWTVKMCNSYRKFEPPKFRNFREKKSCSDTRQFHYAIW